MPEILSPSLDLTLATAERLHLEHVLRLTRGDRTQAAQVLGLRPKAFERLVAKHGLYRDYAADFRTREAD